VQNIAVPVIVSRAGVADHTDNTIQPLVRWDRSTFLADMSMPCTSSINHDCVCMLLQSLT